MTNANLERVQLKVKGRMEMMSLKGSIAEK